MNDNSVKKILILAANPKNSTSLRLDEEVRDIDEGLQRATHRDRFELKQKWAVRPRDVQRAILDLSPQIVHFSGHGVGTEGGEQSAPGTRKLVVVPEPAVEPEGLVFEDDAGQVKLVDTSAIAGLFELFAAQIECVVLNACYSEKQAEAIAQHIPYVIGMSRAVGDKAAIAFAVAFYDALGAGRDFEFAYKSGCVAIKMEGIPEDLTPVLKKRSEVKQPVPDSSEANFSIVETNGVKIQALDSKSGTPASVREVPYQYNDFFTGRKEVLEQLHQKFWSDRSVRSVALSGLPGIGKTQTAIQYAYQYWKDYRYVLWVKCDTRESIISDFTKIAEILNLLKGEKNQNDIVSALKNWLKEEPDWLLILDNADDLNLVHNFLPFGRNGHILVTTRSSVSAPIAAEHLEINKMEQEEGALFLLRRAQRIALDAELASASVEDRMKAKEISSRVDGLPLALDQAGAYIRHTQIDLTEYLDFYESEGAKLRARPNKTSELEHDRVAVTFSIIFNQLEENSAAVDLLYACAFLAPDAIPEEIFIQGRTQLGETLNLLASEPLEFAEVVGEIGRFSLIRRDFKTRVFHIHRVVQDVLKDEMTPDIQRSWAERIIRALDRVFPSPKNYTQWSLCDRLLPHAILAAKYIENFNFEFLEASNFLNQVGRYLYERAQYPEAESLYEHSLRIREQILGQNHHSLADCLNDLAELYEMQGKYSQAESCAQRAKEILEKFSDLKNESNESLATILYNLAMIYESLGRYSDAEELYQKVLKIRTSILGIENVDVAQSLSSLANLYNKQSRYSEAEPLYQQVKEIRERLLGGESPDVALNLNNLALLYENQGRYQDAESFFKKAIGIFEITLELKHPYRAISIDNLVRLYYIQGRYREAEEIHQQAYEIWDKLFKLDHPYAAYSLGHMAKLRHLQGLAQIEQQQMHWDEAEQLYERARAILKKTLGVEHPEVATSLNNLALFYADRGEHNRAEPLYKQAQGIWLKVLPDHPDLATCFNNLALLYWSQGKLPEAEDFYEKARKIWEKSLPKHPNLATNLNNLAILYSYQGNYDEAEPLYRRALEIWEMTLSSNHPSVIQGVRNYADLLRQMGRESEAESLENKYRFNSN